MRCALRGRQRRGGPPVIWEPDDRPARSAAIPPRGDFISNHDRGLRSTDGGRLGGTSDCATTVTSPGDPRIRRFFPRPPGRVFGVYKSTPGSTGRGQARWWPLCSASRSTRLGRRRSTAASSRRAWSRAPTAERPGPRSSSRPGATEFCTPSPSTRRTPRESTPPTTRASSAGAAGRRPGAGAFGTDRERSSAPMRWREGRRLRRDLVADATEFRNTDAECAGRRRRQRQGPDQAVATDTGNPERCTGRLRGYSGRRVRSQCRAGPRDPRAYAFAADSRTSTVLAAGWAVEGKDGGALTGRKELSSATCGPRRVAIRPSVIIAGACRSPVQSADGGGVFNDRSFAVDDAGDRHSVSIGFDPSNPSMVRSPAIRALFGEAVSLRPSMPGQTGRHWRGGFRSNVSGGGP